MPAALDSVVEALTSGPLVDLELPGVVVRDGARRRFLYHYRSLYLRLEQGALIRCKADPSDDTVRLSVVGDIAFDFKLPEGAQYAVVSIAALRLKQPGSRRWIGSLRLLASDPDAARLCVARCAAFGIGNDDCLFLDPLDVSGMHIAGQSAYREWLRSYGRAPEVRYEAVWRYGLDPEIRPANVDALLGGTNG